MRNVTMVIDMFSVVCHEAEYRRNGPLIVQSSTTATAVMNARG
jgi:hypothetical protein